MNNFVSNFSTFLLVLMFLICHLLFIPLFSIFFLKNSQLMDPTKRLFYNEQYEKQNRNIKLVEEFIALPTKKSVTSKFYSKYEGMGPEVAPEKYIKLIERFTESVPKDIYAYQPPTMNMDYGWFTKPLIPRSTDPRLYFPLKQCDVVKTEIRIRDTDKGLPREKFVGTPFYL